MCVEAHVFSFYTNLKAFCVRPVAGLAGTLARYQLPRVLIRVLLALRRAAEVAPVVPGDPGNLTKTKKTKAGEQLSVSVDRGAPAGAAHLRLGCCGCDASSKSNSTRANQGAGGIVSRLSIAYTSICISLPHPPPAHSPSCRSIFPNISLSLPLAPSTYPPPAPLPARILLVCPPRCPPLPRRR